MRAFRRLSRRFRRSRALADANGFTITRTGTDRLIVGAEAKTSTVEKALDVKIDDYTHTATTFGKIKVSKYAFYANATAPKVPARLGIQSISGLASVDRFFTSVQMSGGSSQVRSGGYFPSDLQGLYDVTGHGYDASGQTLGFTLWTANESQTAMTAYANATGYTPITVDPRCVASGNSPTTPSSCATHGSAQPPALHPRERQPRQRLRPVTRRPVSTSRRRTASPRTSREVLRRRMRDHHCRRLGTYEHAAATAPTSAWKTPWRTPPTTRRCTASRTAGRYGGDAEWGAFDPFLIATDNILAIAAAAGTTFYFSTGDAGTYESGFPSDSPYVSAVGGTSTYSTSNAAT